MEGLIETLVSFVKMHTDERPDLVDLHAYTDTISKIAKYYEMTDSEVLSVARKLDKKEELSPNRLHLALQDCQMQKEDAKFDTKSVCNEIKEVTLWERSCDAPKCNAINACCHVSIHQLKQELAKSIEHANRQLKKYNKHIDVQVKIALKDGYVDIIDKGENE